MTKRAKRVAGRWRIVFGSVGMAAALSVTAHAQSPDPSAAQAPSGGVVSATTPPAPSEEFLQLPAHDLDISSTGANAKPGKTVVKVGDSITLSAHGLKGGTQLEVPPGGDSLNDQGWEVVVSPSSGSAAGAQGAASEDFKIVATPLKGGRLSLPSLIIKDAEGKAIARTHPFEIEAESAIKADDPKPDEAADLRPPVSLRFPWWVIAAGALALAALIAAGIYAYRRWIGRKPKPVAVKPAEPPRPEDEIALAAFAELETNGPLKRGEFKKHYFRVSEIIKAYLGARYRFDASESTTRELISHLENRKVVSDEQVDKLESLFERLDLVKFTDHVPLPEEGMRLLGVAKDFVLATRRPPEAPAPAAGGAQSHRSHPSLGVRK